jgi:hypothetical protein
MSSFQFQQSKKRMANEDNAGGEQKNYCLVLNSNDRVGGNHNTAEFNIPYEFLPHNYDYYKMDYAFQTQTGVYKDTYAEFGAITTAPHNILTAQLFDATTPANTINAPGAKITTSDTSLTLPSNLTITAFKTGLGTGGQYQLNQTIPAITTNTFTGTMASGSNTITGVVGTPVIGRFITATGLTTGARILYQDPATPTTWYVSKTASAVITAGTFTQYIPFTSRLNNTVANLFVDFGCKKFIYDTHTLGQSGFMGTIPRYTGSSLTGTNYYKSWYDENPSQIINMNNFTGTIRTKITNGDEFPLVDSTATGLPLADMTPWSMFISFTPIPSSQIETQCY